MPCRANNERVWHESGRRERKGRSFLTCCKLQQLYGGDELGRGRGELRDGRSFLYE